MVPAFFLMAKTVEYRPSNLGNVEAFLILGSFRGLKRFVKPALERSLRRNIRNSFRPKLTNVLDPRSDQGVGLGCPERFIKHLRETLDLVTDPSWVIHQFLSQIR